ncbi:hypothetical protein GBA52_010959 [Prunus armeniaca]|nr:hypothetical protein GBA52_010959 [Prunus armeniaca]
MPREGMSRQGKASQSHNMPRQGKARQGNLKPRQAKPKQGKARQGKACQGQRKASQGKTSHAKGSEGRAKRRQDSTRRSVEIVIQGGPRSSSAARASPTTRAFGGLGPLLRVGKRAAGACVASSPDSDLEAFSHNPTHGSFAPLAFQPSAMTNCANQRFLSY